MKLNKLNKVDYVKNFKYFIIAPLVLLLAGLILFFAVGFNKGIEFTGGTIVNIYVGENIEEQEVYNEVKGKVDEILSNNNLKASVYQISENNIGLCLSVRYQDIQGKTEQEMTEINQKVTDELFAEFGYDSQDSIEKNYIQGSQKIDCSVGTELVVNVFTSIVIASLVILLYMFIRFGVTSGMSALLCVYHDILVMLSLVLICRFEINTSFTAGVIAVMCLSFINTTMYFDKVRESLKLENVIKNKEIANSTVKANLPQSILFNAIIFTVLVLFGIIAVADVVSFAFPVAFGLLASFYSSNFIAPTLWSFAYVKKTKIKKVKQEKATENI